MSIDLQTENKDVYLEVCCHGVYHKDALLDAVDRALCIGANDGAETVVLDVCNIHIEGRPPDMLERYYLGEMVAKIQRRHARLVFLAVVGNEPLIDPGRFGETVALNRGAYAKVFDEMEEAIEWIKNNEQARNGHNGDP